MNWKRGLVVAAINLALAVPIIVIDESRDWNYQRSVVCEHTPFYFQGMRVQIYPSDRVKIEPWVMNGWQTYGRLA